MIKPFCVFLYVVIFSVSPPMFLPLMIPPTVESVSNLVQSR